MKMPSLINFGPYFYLTGQERKFLCPECRADTKFPDRGAEAFPDNRFTEEMIRLMKVMQIGDICQKHKQHLVLFCNDKDCQEQICPACVLVKHKDHDIMDLSSKADEVRGKMADRKEKARDISLLLGEYLTELNSIEEKVNKDTSKNLDKVDETCELLHKRIQDLHKKVQEETETYKMELIQVQKRNLDHLKFTKDEIQQYKVQLDSFYVDIEKSINCLPDNAVVQNDGNVEQVFDDLSRKDTTKKKFNLMIQEPKYEEPDVPTQLEMLRTGKIYQVETKVQAPHRLIALRRMGLKGDEVKNINHKLLQSENTSFNEFFGMCLSKDGSVIMSGRKINEYNCWLKCTRNGANIWELNSQMSVPGLCIVNRKKEYLINTVGRRLEVRDVTDGRLLYGCDVDFDPGFMCSTDGSILVRNSSVTPRTLVKFKLTEGDGVKLETTNETFNTQMEYVNGLSVPFCDNRKLVILTSWTANMIQAINYQTGATEWKIKKGRIDRKVMEPYGICHDDVGHLFVADWDNNRVLVVSTDGKIKQKLLDLPGQTKYITFNVTQQKLIVQYNKVNEHIFNIYDIEYITQ